jgi:hypothetical protein
MTVLIFGRSLDMLVWKHRESPYCGGGGRFARAEGEEPGASAIRMSG